MTSGRSLLSLDRPLFWALLALANAVLLYLQWSNGGWLFHRDGSVWAHDFLSHWAAGKRALSGQSSMVYDVAAQNAYQTKLIGAGKPVEMGFFYPPPFLLTIIPFAWLDLASAYVAFLCTTICLYVLALRLVTGNWLTAIPAAAAGGGAYFSLLYVQNGFLTAALITAGLAVLPRRPRLAGIAFGLLTFKPQIGILIPFALAAAGYWKTIGWAVVTAVLMAAFAELALGPGIWGTFLSSATHTTGFLEGGNIWFKMQSSFAISLPFFGSAAAYAVHFVIAAAVAWAVIRIWSNQRNSSWLKGAALIAGSLLMSPYLFAYDSVMITAAALMLIREEPDLPLTDRMALIAACLLPGLAKILLSAAVPMAAATVLVLVMRQIERRDAAAASSVGFGR